MAEQVSGNPDAEASGGQPLQVGESRRVVHESVFGPARLSDIGATGERRVVVTGRIKPGRKTVELRVDNAFAGNPKAAGLVQWSPVWPAQPRNWIDGDHQRKVEIESEDRV